MRIPHQDLSPDALRGLIEEFVTRDGTDYGPEEMSLAGKISQIERQLRQNEIYISYDADSESCTFRAASEPEINPAP